MSKPTLAIISSVPEGVFFGISITDNRFSGNERNSALMEEKQVFLDAIGIPDLEKEVQIQVVRAMDGIPRGFSADAYILGGSPSMVTDAEKEEWISRLVRFVRSEVESGKPLFGICFGHQVLAHAFGGQVANMESRVIGPGGIKTKAGEEISSFWSHKQAVYRPGEADVIADSGDVIQMIQVGDNAHGVQFHPEFTPEFTAFLVKLMEKQIISEGLDSDRIVAETYLQENGNPSRRMLEGFIKKYYNL